MEIDDNNQELYVVFEYVEENEINLAELQPTLLFGRITKTYTFNITKCNKVFYLLVADVQIIVLKGLKTPPS